MVLSILVSIGAAICGIVHVASDKIQGKAIGILLLITSILAIIGLGIFIDIKKGDTYYLETI